MTHDQQLWIDVRKMIRERQWDRLQEMGATVDVINFAKNAKRRGGTQMEMTGAIGIFDQISRQGSGKGEAS
jgi:ribosomal protein S1